MSKNLNIAKTFNNKVFELKDSLENTIAIMMKKKNVSLISFTRNGEHSDLDVDPSFAVVNDVDGVAKYEEIFAVAIVNGRLLILTDSLSKTSDTYSILDEHTFFSLDAPIHEILEIESFVGMDEIFSPLQTLSELVNSVAEMLEKTEQEGVFDNIAK